MDIETAKETRPESVKVFCCYARKDQLILKKLKKHLMPLQREGLITFRADIDINAGMGKRDSKSSQYGPNYSLTY